MDYDDPPPPPSQFSFLFSTINVINSSEIWKRFFGKFFQFSA